MTKPLLLARLALVSGLFWTPLQALAGPQYAWKLTQAEADTLEQRFSPPEGFQRLPVKAGSWAEWLRGLKLKPEGTPVLTFTGGKKWRQDVHAGIVDIDIGKRDLQQCADAIMRLRAEWLFASNRKSDIAFNYTGGGRVPFSRWARGERPSQSGKSWRKRAKADGSYASFRRYMTQIFAFAGTYSLDKELKTVADKDIAIGDVFIKGGFPGHAVLVADMAKNPTTGEKRFLLLQSYMPAQDIHVLKNPQVSYETAWYSAKLTWPFQTPEWIFPQGSLKRWPD